MKPLFPDARFRSPTAVNTWAGVPRRLRPLIEVSWETGHALQTLGVPVDGVEREKADRQLQHGMRSFRIPECCAELFLDRTTPDLQGLKTETLARLAADVYFEEVKGTNVRRSFGVGTGQMGNALKRKLERAGHKGSPGKSNSTLYSLTQVEAEAFGFNWNF